MLRANPKALCDPVNARGARTVPAGHGALSDPARRLVRHGGGESPIRALSCSHFPKKRHRRWLKPFLDFAAEEANGAPIADWIALACRRRSSNPGWMGAAWAISPRRFSPNPRAASINGDPLRPSQLMPWCSANACAHRAPRRLSIESARDARRALLRPPPPLCASRKGGANLELTVKMTLAPGICLWREKFSPIGQKTLLDGVLARLEQAPLYRPVMPGTGKPFSVEESNFGRLGWVSDRSGYRYPDAASRHRQAMAGNSIGLAGTLERDCCFAATRLLPGQSLSPGREDGPASGSRREGCQRPGGWRLAGR